MKTATNDNASARDYPRGKKAEAKVGKVMSEFKGGELKSSGKPVTDRKQAVAIALSEARRPKKK